MKKSFIALCATVLAFAACQKEEVKVVPELKVSSETAITVKEDGGIFNVEFESNVAWTAALDVEKEAATLNLTSGTAEDKKVKVTVNPLTEANASRVITLTLTPENGEGVKVVFTQNGPYVPYFKVSESELTFGKEGGSKSFTIDTNCDKTKITVDAPTIGTIRVNEAFTEATFTMPANTAWAEVSDRVKFTVEDIQDPVLDEDGNDTGETAAHVERVYAYQDGHAEVAYFTEFTDALVEGSTYNTALAGDYFLVANGTATIHAYEKATGKYVQAISAVGDVTGLCNDDAGNIVLMTGGMYPYDDNHVATPMVTYFIPAATPFDASTYKEGFTCDNQFWGFGYNNISANGNVLEGDALIEVLSAGGSYNVCFVLKDGKRADDGQYTDYVSLPSSPQGSKWGAARHLSTDINGGLYYSGYAGNYELFYNPSMTGANWVVGCESGGSWIDGIVSMEFAEFNGHKYLVAYSYSFFVSWGPAYIDLFIIDEPSAPVLQARYPVLGAEGTNSTSADINVEVVDGNLNVYIADGTQKGIFKCVFPPLN